VYTRSYLKSDFVADADSDLILEIYKEGRPEDRFLLAQALYLLFLVKRDEALSTSSSFLLAANQREAEHFFTYLAGNDAVSYTDMSHLILVDSVRFDISYPIEKCLSRILQCDGTNVVFQYLIRRFEFKALSIENSENYFAYEFVPSGGQSHLFDDAECYKDSMFEAAAAWYINLNAPSHHAYDYFAKNLIEYLLPGKSMNQTTSSWYLSKIELLADEPQKLQRLVETIGAFEKKNEIQIQLIARILTIASSKFDIESDEYSRLWFACSEAISQVGAKSGTYGMPFQEDLDLKDLIEGSLSRYPDNSEFRKMLIHIHKKVQLDISRSIERGESSSW
jgi:hypothetical protein